MSSDRFVSYIRLGAPIDEVDAGSASRSAATPNPGQGSADPVLAAQRDAVARHLGRGGRLVAEMREAEPGRPGADRPELREALALCHHHGATLLVAELGTLSMDAAFLSELCGHLRRLGLRFVAADMPEANELTIGLMAAVAEAEDRLGTERTSAALSRRRAFYARFAAERRAESSPGRPVMPSPDAPGLRPLAESLGRGDCKPKTRQWAQDVAPILGEIRAAGALTLEQVANALNALGIPSARGNRWYPMQVTRIEKRLALVG